MQKNNKETAEKYFGKGIVEKVTEQTDGLIINGKATVDRDRLGVVYKTLAGGEYPPTDLFVHAMQAAITYGIFAKMEQQTGKVYSHPFIVPEIMQIENVIHREFDHSTML